MDERTRSPTFVDVGYQWVFRLGYWALSKWWWLIKPKTQGAFVGVWCQGQVLTLQNSYVSFRSFPGGGIRRSEAPEVAAARECLEEVGLRVAPEALSLDLVLEQDLEGKRDTVWMYWLELSEMPALVVDHREVVEARFMKPSDALAGALFWPARRHLENRSAELARSSSLG